MKKLVMVAAVTALGAAIAGQALAGHKNTNIVPIVISDEGGGSGSFSCDFGAARNSPNDVDLCYCDTRDFQGDTASTGECFIQTGSTSLFVNTSNPKFVNALRTVAGDGQLYVEHTGADITQVVVVKASVTEPKQL